MNTQRENTNRSVVKNRNEQSRYTLKSLNIFMFEHLKLVNTLLFSFELLLTLYFFICLCYLLSVSFMLDVLQDSPIYHNFQKRTLGTIP